MATDFSEVFDRLTDLRMSIDALQELVTNDCWHDEHHNQYNNVLLAHQMVVNTLRKIADAPQSSETVEVAIDDQVYLLSKLERHLLYCMDDQRMPSSRYTFLDRQRAMNELETRGLCVGQSDLTERGKAVVAALRARNG